MKLDSHQQPQRTINAIVSPGQCVTRRTLIKPHLDERLHMILTHVRRTRRHGTLCCLRLLLRCACLCASDADSRR